MENKEFPEQEEFLPEETFLPDMTEPEEEPLIQELTFQEPEDIEPQFEEPTPAFEDITYAPPAPIQDEASVEEEAPILEALPIYEEAPQENYFEAEAPLPQPEQSAGEDFMSLIPDVEEDYPLESMETEENAPQEFPEMEEDILPVEEVPDEDPADQEYRDNDADFDQLFEAPQEPTKAPAKQHPVRKGRPKRKKGEGLWGIPNILATFVWLALILAIGVTAGRMLWVCAADVLAFGREDKPVTVTIYEADDMDSITDKLYDAGLIRYKSLFNLYASISDAEEKIQPGIYDLNTLYDYHALVNFMMPRSSRQVVEVTIPEGYTCRQIFALLEEHRVCTAQDAAAYAANGELDDYWFLEGVERGTENCLEGYLFPDTYEFYKNSTPREALQRLLNNFEAKFTEEMRLQLDTLNANLTGNYSVRDVVIVASLIEKESARWDESDKIAGVIYNRLFKWEGVPAYLNIDAAIVYAQGGEAETIDTSLDSPYNTYTHVGLTPGPIANPGMSSLEAALNPAEHDYYYYVLNPATGMHQFSETQEEHNRYIAEFYGN